MQGHVDLGLLEAAGAGKKTKIAGCAAFATSNPGRAK
jgi:hypothetical protein